MFIDGAQVAGEGEIKICQRLKKIQSITQTFAIISDDSDAIVQALASRTSAFKCDIINLQKEEIFSVHVFVDLLCQQLPNRDPLDLSIEFATLAMFLGNDYLPKLKFQCLLSLWTRYINLARTNVSFRLINHETKSFNFQMLGELLNFKTGIESQFSYNDTNTLKTKQNPNITPCDDFEDFENDNNDNNEIETDSLTTQESSDDRIVAFLSGILCILN